MCQIPVICIFAVIGLIFIGISIPLLLEKIEPNYFYGFRVAKTLNNREIWFKANKYMAKGFFITGCIQTIYNLGLFIIKPPDIACAGNLIILVGGTLIVVITSFLYLRKL